MSTDEPTPAHGAAEPNYAAETEAMEELARAGFQLMNVAGPENAPEQLTYVRSCGEHTDFVYLALHKDAFSTAVRYPLVPVATNLDEASGEIPPAPLEQVKPGSIVDVITAALEWPRG